MRLLDTDVMVDMVRGYLPALHWFASLTEQPGLPGIVMMELVEGCANKVELRRIEQLLKPYVLFWPTPVDCQMALFNLTQFYLSHRLGLTDSLTAATAIGEGAMLCTFNVKHFAAVHGLVTKQPYARI